MAQKYSDDQLAEMADFYHEHGAVKLPGLVDPVWAQKVMAAIDHAIACYSDQRVPGVALSYGRGDGRMTIRYMWRENPLIREFLFRDALAEPIAKISRSKELRFWFDLTFVHEASAAGTAGEGSAWHHDIAAFPFKGEQLPSLWMAMTPAVEGQSRLEFIDRSHKTVPGFYRPPTNTTADENDGYITPPDFDALVRAGKEKILAWDCQPGDAVMIHPYQLHGSKGNSGNAAHGRRVAMTSRWLGDDVRWLPTNPSMGKFVAGQSAEKPFLLGSRPEGEFFPLVWKA